MRHDDVIAACQDVARDAPADAATCRPLQDEADHVVLDDEVPLADGCMIRRFASQVRGSADEYLGRLYIIRDGAGAAGAHEIIFAHRHDDASTGLPDRYLFHDRPQQEIKKTARTALAGAAGGRDPGAATRRRAPRRRR